MIPNLKDRELETQGVTDSHVFGISVDDTAHIMGILRDTLYSDKVMAVLREYSANAWDAHRDAGKGDVPIKVTIPTDMDPTLRIQDFGLGLSHEDVFYVFTQYGASTKRNSNNSVGQLGIGSKSGFAYSDSFTVISCYGGKRRTYVAVLDASEKGVINLFDEQDCLPEETGLTIEIAVRKNDIQEFISKATSLYTYFHPRPDVNIPLPEIVEAQHDLKSGRILESGYANEWTAVMGCVPYRINIDQLYENGVRMVGSYVDEIKGVLYFDIGEVLVGASREELKYSDSTKKAIAEKFTKLMEEYVESTLRNLEAGTFTMWQRRLRARMMSQLDLPLPDALADLCKEWVELPAHKTFNIYKGGGSNPLVRVTTEKDTRIFIRTEDSKSLGGYSFTSDDFTARPTDGHTVAEMVTELEVVLKEAGLDGIEIKNLSSLPWTKPWQEEREERKKLEEAAKKARAAELRKERQKNKKWAHRIFLLDDEAHFQHPYSQMWKALEDQEPRDTDVYVVLNNFVRADREKSHYKDTQKEFCKQLRADVKICRAFGIQMPRFVGYKSTEKKPIDPKTLKGTEYFKWREKFFRNASVTKHELATALADYQYVQAWPYGHHNRDVQSANIKKCLDKGIKVLGQRHPITKWVSDVYDAALRYKGLSPSVRSELEPFSLEVLPKGESDPMKCRKAFDKQYPMMVHVHGGIADLLGNDYKAYVIDYIKDMDKLRRLQNRRS